MSSEQTASNFNSINTQGGVSVGGNVNTGGGDFIGRDQNIFTEETAYNIQGLANPYLGLRPFGYNDQSIYAGREQQAHEAVHWLTKPGAPQTLLFITGASGSGKSSFVQAALIPLLEKHYSTYQKLVRPATFRPSNQPLVMLADALQQLHPALTTENLVTHTPHGQVNLLVIDQFEELFIQSDTSQLTPFFDFLTELPSFTVSRTHILATLRVDYLDELYPIQPLWAAAKASVELRVMPIDNLRNSIQKPLQVHYPQKRFSPELLEQLVLDASADAALLPLLQETLAKLWKSGKLVLANYYGLTDAIRQRAEIIYQFSDHVSDNPKSLRSTHQQQEMIEILLDMIHVSADGADRRDIRQRRMRRDLEQGDMQRAQLIEELINARLLAAHSEIRNGESVEVIDIIHESLISNWDRLYNAIEEQSQRLQQRARFKLWLSEWVRSGGQDGYLLVTDIQLAEARTLMESRDIELQGTAAQEFYARSVNHANTVRARELEQQKQLANEQRRRAEVEKLRAEQAEEHAKTQSKISNHLRLALKSITAISIFLLCATGVAYYQTVRVNETNQHLASTLRSSTTMQLAASALSVIRESEPTGDLGILLAREAVSRTLWTEGYVTAQADAALRAAVSQSSWNMTIPIDYHSDIITAADFSPDGSKLVSTGNDGSLILWNMADGQVLHVFRNQGAGITDVKFSPDGTMIASSSFDNSVTVWEVETGKLSRTFAINVSPIDPRIAFSPSGRLLAAYHNNNKMNNSGLVTVWNIADNSVVQERELHDSFVDFKSDNEIIIKNDNMEFIIWDIFTNTLNKLPIDYKDKKYTIKLTGGSKDLDVADRETTYTILDKTNYKILQITSIYKISIIEYNTNTKVLATTYVDNTIALWDATTGNYIHKLSTPYPFLYLAKFVHINLDGTKLVVGGSNRVLQVWDLQNNAISQTFGSHVAPIKSAVISANGAMIVSGSDDGTVRLWNRQSGQLIHTIYAHTSGVSSVLFSPDESYIISAGADSIIRQWNTKDGTPIGEIKGRFFGGINSVEINTDGTEIIAAGGGNIRIWNVKTKELLRSFMYGHEILSATFDPNKRIIVGGTANGKLLIWKTEDAYSDAPHILSAHNGAVNSIDFSSDGKLLVTAGTDAAIKLWDIENYAVTHTFLDHIQEVNYVQFSPNNNLIISASDDGTGKLWDVRKLELIRTLSGHRIADGEEKGQPAPVHSASFNPQGDLIITASEDLTVRLWDVNVTEPMRILKAPEPSSIALSPDGKLLASSGSDDIFRLWDINSGKEIFSLQDQSRIEYTNAAAFSPDGKLLVTGGSQGVVDIWDIDTKEKLRSIPQEPNSSLPAINSIDFSPNGDFIAYAGRGALIIRKAQNDEVLYEFNNFSVAFTFRRVEFSPNSQLLAVSDYSNIYVLNVVTGKQIAIINNTSGVFVFAPDSLRILIASSNNQIEIRSAQTGELLRILTGNNVKINSIAFHPNKQLIVTANENYTLTLWDIEQGITVDVIQGHTDTVSDAIFTPDGNQIISTSYDNTIRIWLADINEILRLADARIQRYPPHLTRIEKETYGISEE